MYHVILTMNGVTISVRQHSRHAYTLVRRLIPSNFWKARMTSSASTVWFSNSWARLLLGANSLSALAVDTLGR